MDKVKKYGFFFLGVIAVLFVAKMVKPMLPEAIGKYLPA